MIRCAACDHPGEGYAHICTGSGTFVAEEAYDADAVLEEASKDWPYFTVKVECRMRAQDEQMVREKLTPLASAILDDDFAEMAHFTVEPEAA